MYVCLYIKYIYIYIFIYIHINICRGNHMACSCITGQDISMHYSIFYILITLPNTFGGTDVLCSLTPWTDLPICQTEAHVWTFQVEKILKALWNPPGACRWNETLRNTLFKQHLRIHMCIYAETKFILLQMGTETELINILPEIRV